MKFMKLALATSMNFIIRNESDNNVVTVNPHMSFIHVLSEQSYL